MHRTSALRALAVLLCAVSSAEAQAPRVIDNPRPTWTAAQALRLSAAPTVVIDGSRPGAMYEFSRIMGVARLRDGRIVVADNGSTTLRFFDSTGIFLKSVGGKGEGPGEFQQLETFTLVRGDTIVAGSSNLMSTFTGTGQFIQRYTGMNPSPLPPGVAPVVGSRPTLHITRILTFLDGSGGRVTGMLVTPPPAHSGATPWLDSFPVTIMDGKNAKVGDLGMLPYALQANKDGKPEGFVFGATPLFASDGTHLYTGFGSEYAIRVYDTRGTLQHIIRRAWTPVPVTRKDIDSYVVAWGKRWIVEPDPKAETKLATLRGRTYATTTPAFGQFIADKTGRLWVREAHVVDFPSVGFDRTPLAPSIWSVFDRTGRWLGDVSMPTRFLPFDIGADYVIGVVTDEETVQTVAMYRMSAGKP